MTRIGLLVYGLDRPLTGISRYTFELVRGMAQLEPRPPLTLIAAGGTDALAVDTFPIVSLPLARLLPNLMTVGQLGLRRIVQQHKLTAIHDLTGVLPFGCLPTDVTQIVTLQDVFALSLPGYSSRLDALIYTRWLPRRMAKVRHVITSSEHSKREIVRWLGVSAEKITTIPLGVAPIYRQLPTVRDKLAHRFALTQPYIVFVGNMTERKNLRRALEAFATLAPDFPELQFVLAGSRSWRKTPIEAIVLQHDIAARVQMVGSVSDQELVWLYNGAEMLLFPSLYEGFGLPVIEAMACGTPVITSNGSSLPEVAGEAALLVEPTDVAAIAGAMRRLLLSADLRQTLIQRGLSQVQQYTWAQTARATAKIYGL